MKPLAGAPDIRWLRAEEPLLSLPLSLSGTVRIIVLELDLIYLIYVISLLFLLPQDIYVSNTCISSSSKRIFFSKETVLFHACATFSELPSNINTMVGIPTPSFQSYI